MSEPTNEAALACHGHCAHLSLIVTFHHIMICFEEQQTSSDPTHSSTHSGIKKTTDCPLGCYWAPVIDVSIVWSLYTLRGCLLCFCRRHCSTVFSPLLFRTCLLCFSWGYCLTVFTPGAVFEPFHSVFGVTAVWWYFPSLTTSRRGRFDAPIVCCDGCQLLSWARQTTTRESDVCKQHLCFLFTCLLCSRLAVQTVRC